MKLLHSKLILSTFLIILPIYVSQLLEHRLWKNYGQIIYDYSGNSRHGWNGRNINADTQDCLFTDRGAYLNSSCRISMLPFLFTNPISISIWAISDDTMPIGRLFCRWSATRKIMLYRDKTFSRANARFQGQNSLQFLYGDPNVWFASINYLDVWVFITIEVNQNILKVYRNSDTILQYSDPSDYNDEAIPPPFHLGNDQSINIGFGGFVWYIAIIYYKYQASCSCTSIGQGCCKPECASCSDEISCITCKDSFSYVVNGQCVCIDGYAADQTKTV